MVSTPLKRKGQLADDSFGIPRARPQGTGIRTRWRKLSTGARSMLCIHAASSAYEDYYDWPSDSKDFLHTRSRSDLSWPTVSQDGGVSSSSSSPLHSTPRRAQRTHAEKAGGKNEAKEATKTPTAIRAPEQTSHSEAAASLNALLIKEKGAHRRGDASPFCDRASSVFRFDGTTSTSTTTMEHHHQVESGDTIRALIDTMFQIGDRSCASSPGPPPMPFTDDAVSEKTAKTRKEDEDEGRTSANRVAGRQKKTISAGRRWEAKEDADAAADARRAWEALKRRVMYIEEHGALPDDFEEEEDAASSASAAADHRYRGAEAEEGALRDRRACSRKCWAQEVLVRWQAGQQQQQQHPHPHLPHPPLQQQLGHGQARDEKKGAGPKEEKDSEEAAATTTATTATRREKGRRHGGCWIRKKDGVFVRLVSLIFSPHVVRHTV